MISIRRFLGMGLAFAVTGLTCLTTTAQESEIVTELIAQLGPSNSAEDRIEAAVKLIDIKSPEILKARSELLAGMKDADPKVRLKFMLALCMGLGPQGMECPNLLFEMLEDSDAAVKGNAEYMFDFFEKFPDDFLDRFLAYYQKLDSEKRPNFLTLLAKVDGSDKRVLKILREAVNGNHAAMRVNGTAAMWIATKDLDVVVPLYLDRISDYEEVAELPEGESGRFTGRFPKMFIQLAIHGLGSPFHEQLAKRKQDFAKALNKVASSKDPDIRRRLVLWINYSIAFAIGHREKQTQPTVEPQTNPYQLPECDYEPIKKLLTKMATDDSDEVQVLAEKGLALFSKLKSPEVAGKGGD